MKPLVLLLPLAALAVPPALAQPWPGGPQRGELSRPVPSGTPLVPDRGEYRDVRNPGDMPRGDRMSPDERRQLRRDINDAGRELYREPPGRHWRRGPGF
jgi:hypothetical protein